VKCASCGRDGPAGARFCVHCGAEQSPPTPIAVAAAAMATRPRSPVPQAANASQADVAQDGGRIVSRATRHQPDAWGGDTQSPAFPAGSDPFDFPDPPPLSAAPLGPPPATPAAIPVYASHPRRLGIAAVLIAACVVVALLAFVFWKMRQDEPAVPAVADGDRGPSVMSTFPPEATPQRAPRQPDAAAASSAESSPPASGAAAPASPVEIKPLPAKPVRKPSVPAPASKSVPPSAPAVVAEPVPVPARPQVAAAAPKAPAVDRWTQMNDELSRCTREDFISRVICDQRVRFRYCNGYWGTVPQCPGNPAPERR